MTEASGSAARPSQYERTVSTLAASIAVSWDSGCGTTSLRNRRDPRKIAETALRTLISLGWTPPKDDHDE